MNKRLHIYYSGSVQGVGFRPFVHRVATRLGLRWWVRNDSEGVLIRAVGPAPAVTALLRALKTEAPRSARVQDVEAHPTGAADQGPAGAFRITSSGPGGLPVSGP